MPAVGQSPFDALLVVSFGGPEGPDDVLPFLENVTRGRAVPRERLAEVAANYERFGGVSPLNARCRELVAAVDQELHANGPPLPVYWGNRNWHPLLADTLRTMRADGVRRALAFVTSAYSSYSSCRQYLEDIERARAEVGEGAPIVDKLRVYFDHPGFVDPMARNVRAAMSALPRDARLVYTAHSIPIAMADTSGYVSQLRETARLVTERASGSREWDLVWQSRSGPPTVPWLEPDVGDHLAALAGRGVRAVVVAPIGFVLDHMEVVYDLDTVLAARARQSGIAMVRAATVGAAPEFVALVRELVLERLDPGAPRRALSTLGVWPDACAPGCCPRR